MIYYTLPNDVYLVKGYTHSCFYDLANGSLFSISNELYNFVCKGIKNSNLFSTALKGGNPTLSYLLKENLIVASDKKASIVPITSLKEKIKPSFAWIEVTKKCNLSCDFCYESCSPNTQGEMSLSQFKIAIDQIQNTGIDQIQLIGGEPLLLQDKLKSMLTFARPFFRTIEVYTNGTLINKEWCKFFKDLDFKIALSIHSYIANQHDKTTHVYGSHKKVEQGIALLKSHGISHRIATIQSKFCDIGHNLNNACHYKLDPKLPKATGKASVKKTFNKKMLKKKLITEANMRRPLNKSLVVKSVSGHKCFMKDFYIDCFLNVFPCVMERRYCYGNLAKINLIKCIEDKVRLLSKDNIKTCMDCEYRYHCHDCRPDSNGSEDMLEKPWFCTYDPYNGQWATDLDGFCDKLLKPSVDSTTKTT
jgi:sulfatase maturation enzyme AslB (radical SAM superfamily)